MVLGGLLSISILQLPTIRKNMRMQTEQDLFKENGSKDKTGKH